MHSHIPWLNKFVINYIADIKSQRLLSQRDTLSKQNLEGPTLNCYCPTLGMVL